ncbi:Prostaglandin E synthase 3 [Acipenser ruthenus]|uniref:Prostaglandin E synthase 3 n=1 Tax=Acipenser ruthenus TaxID=7906 RepID=A0A444UX37_ACIRT|nr:Prostaglandin E synthase 3 [Acipenser ruthenus]
MEANNHYNYSGHSSMSASSGLKRSSGETLYTNGSTMSFPQQGKNLNGEMNVNGITTAIGTSGSGSLPSTAYSLMGNHHQPNLGYDYLWDLAQYPSAMGGGTHHKDSPAGVATQQHFQGHGQYQLNGGVGMRQPPNTAAIPGRVGQQFWGGNATNSQQQNSSPSSLMNFNSHGMYAAYQSQPHAPTPQQHQHYGMVPNGLPYYTAPPAVAVSPPVTGTPENRAVSIGDSTVGASQPLVGPAAASPCAEPEAFLPEPALEKPLNDSSVIDDSLNSTSDNMASDPATGKWYDRRDSVFIEFCVEDSKDVKVNFENSKLSFSCLGGVDNVKYLNEVDLFDAVDPNVSKHKRTDRSVLCCLRKAEAGKSWPRVTKDKAKLNWLSVDFNNWKDWEDDSDEEASSFDRFSDKCQIWSKETQEYLYSWKEELSQL